MLKIKGLYLPMVAGEMVTGSVFWVDSSKDDALDASGYGKSPDKPFATLDYAFGDHGVTADSGDMIVLGENHAETVTAAIAADVAGVRVVGIKEGRKLPVITGNGAIDAITVTADGVTLKNIEFAVPGTDAQTADINIAAAKCAVIGTVHHGSTTDKNKVDIITITSAGHDALIDGAMIYNDTVEVVAGITLEGAAKRVVIRNVVFQDSVGFTSGAIRDSATALQLLIENCVFTNAKADTVCMEFGNNTTGICRDTFCNGRHTTIASNLAAGTGMSFYETYAVEEAAKNGMIMPALDAD